MFRNLDRGKVRGCDDDGSNGTKKYGEKKRVGGSNE